MMAAELMATVTLHNLGPLERIPLGEGRTFKVGDEEVAVFRARNGKVYGAQARCPHRGGPLADGLLGGSKVLCPLHGYAFDLESGAALRNSCEALRTFLVEVTAEGEIVLAMPD